jgi:hypothetical protein
MKSLSKKRGALLGSLMLTAALTFEGQFAYAQVKVGDNPETINAGSALEVESLNKGLLLPRVHLFTTGDWTLAGEPVAGMQVYNVNFEIFGSGAYPAIPGGNGIYYWDGSGWVGTKNTSQPEQAVGDFDWLKTSNDANPALPGDISTSIYHGGAGNQDIIARTTELTNGRFARFSVRTGHGQNEPIVSNFFAENNVQTGRTAGIQVTSTDPLVFRTTNVQNLAPTERLRITNLGKVGVATTTPEAELHVTGQILQSSSTTKENSTDQVSIENGSITALNSKQDPSLVFSRDKNMIDYSRVSYGANSDSKFKIAVFSPGALNQPAKLHNAVTIPMSNGFVGINDLNPSYQLSVTGDISATGEVRNSGVILTSDARLKRNIHEFENGLALVSKLKPVSYEKKASIDSKVYDKSEIGFIAQEVQKILPQLVREGKDADKTLALDYNSLIPVLTKAIQEQQKQIELLTNQNQQLTGKVATLDQSAKLVSALAAELAEIKQMLTPATAAAEVSK